MIVNLIDIVNRQLTNRAVAAVEAKERDYSHFHPSEWDNCKRKIAYSFYEAKGFISIDKSALKIDPKGERIFDNGHSMHSRWRKYLSWTNALMGRWMCRNWMAHKERKIYGLESKLGVLRPDKCECGSDRFEYIELGFLDKETLWGGHVDAVIDNKRAGIAAGFEDVNCSDDERYIVVDFKTMNDYEFKKLTEPKPQHITQVQIYLYLAGLKFGKFIYENKNTQETKEFLVPRDDALLAVKKAEAIALKSLVESSNAGGRPLPKRGFDSKTHYQCTRCKFRGDCWDSRHGRPKAPKPDDAPRGLVLEEATQSLVDLNIGEMDV